MIIVAERYPSRPIYEFIEKENDLKALKSFENIKNKFENSKKQWKVEFKLTKYQECALQRWSIFAKFEHENVVIFYEYAPYFYSNGEEYRRTRLQFAKLENEMYVENNPISIAALDNYV